MKALLHHRFFVRLFSCLLCLGLLFAFPLSVSAAEIDGFYSREMSFTVKDNNDNNITSSATVSTGTYLNRACTIVNLPFTDSGFRTIWAYHIEDLNSSHEYNIKFSASSSVLPEKNVFHLVLVFYDNSNTTLKEQILYDNALSPQWTDIDIDFKPDTSGLGGYKSRIEFRYLTTSTVSQQYRISEIVEFTDKDDNSSWFEKIINAIKELPSNFVNGVKGFFDNLGEKFESVGNSITNKFEEVKNAIGQWFTDIGDRLSSKFEEVGNAISSKFQEIGDKFSATFDKFKPRFYEDLNWVNAFVNTNTGELQYSPSLSVKKNASTSDMFYIPSGSLYNLDFLILSDDVNYVRILKYNLDGSYITYFSASPGTNVLDSGYCYRFQICYKYDVTGFSSSDLSDLCNSYVKLYADEGWLSAFGHYILNGLKSLFIPSDDYFQRVIDTFEALYVDHFGIFAQFQVFFEDTLTHFKNLLSDNYTFTFPKISFPINGETFVLVEEQTVDMSLWLYGDSWSSRLYKIYRLCASSVMIFAVLQYASKVEHLVLGVNNYDFIVDRM